MSGERMVDVRGTRLCVETFGDPADPAVLLVGGASMSMVDWPEDLCLALARGGRRVVRYDARDTGRSATDAPGEPSYTGDDLSEDPVGVLDALGVDAAHLVGVSMGGGIAQTVALRHPDRVASLTLVATSAAYDRGPDATELPPMADRLQTYVAAPPPDPDWTDDDAVAAHLLRERAAYAGSLGVDDDQRAAVRATVARTDSIASAANHWVVIEGGEEEAGPPRRLAEIAAPTLVLHGTDDPMFPVEHGEALATGIPGARLVRLPGMGHEVPPRPTWPTVVPEILRHTSGGWEQQADRLARRALADGAPTRWFDELYAAASTGAVDHPWDHDDPNPGLAHWARQRPAPGPDARAVVVGCGLGGDAEFVASLGYRTDAFDVSETAVALARARHPGSSVTYRVGDVLALPDEWQRAYDLVVEVFTVQALPVSLREDVVRAIAGLAAPGGTVVAIQAVADGDRPDGPPWPLTRPEIDLFERAGLVPRSVEVLRLRDRRDRPLWLAELTRPRPDGFPG